MNAAWALRILDGLVRGGVRNVAVCPGSRSTPLALAAWHHPSLRVRVVLDERCAGFWAVGVGKATGAPAAVVTTSGTAVANLLPAVVEAGHAAVPMVVLTADRPNELRNRGANQTIEQRGIFAGFTRRFVDLPHPDTASLDALDREVARAMREALGRCPGPVHLNQPLREPLEPDAADLALLAAVARTRPDPAPAAREAPMLRVPIVGGRGVVVAGPGPVSPADAARILSAAAALDAPVLADPLSGLRYATGDDGGDVITQSAGDALDEAERTVVVSAYDAWVDAVDPRPDWVLQFGATPTSKTLGRWLGRHDDRRIRVDSTGRRWDDLGTPPRWVDGEPADVVEALAAECRETEPEPAWLVADEAARAALDPQGMEAAAVVAALGAARGGRLFVGNSLAVRDLDRFGHAAGADVQALGNRGASGIDGNLATIAGIADGAGGDGPTLGVVGDLTFQHDVGGLALLRHTDARVVVVQNGGGGIFRHLPVAAAPHFEELFLTPQRFNVAAACAAFGVEHARARADGRDGAGDALRNALRDGAQVVEVVVDGPAAARRRREVSDAAARAAHTAWTRASTAASSSRRRHA